MPNGYFLTLKAKEVTVCPTDPPNINFGCSISPISSKELNIDMSSDFIWLQDVMMKREFSFDISLMKRQ